MLKTCNCVLYWMPREVGTRICPPEACGEEAINESNKILKEADENFDMQGDSYEYEEYDFGSLDEPDDTLTKCHCLPACTEIHYKSEVTKTEFDPKFADESPDVYVCLKSQVAKSLNEKFPSRYSSEIKVFYNSDHLQEVVRDESYQWFNFLADCGGKCMTRSSYSFQLNDHLFQAFSGSLWADHCSP